jgi:hypothetical protein
MKQKLSDQESHALYCPIKNVKSALFVAASFSVIAFASWKGLDKPPEHYSFVQLLLVAIFVVAIVAPWLVEFTCVRERLLLCIVIISLLKMEVQGFAPSVFSKHVELVKSGELASALIGLFVSLTMLIQAIRSPGVEPNNAGTGGTPLDS